MRREIIGLVPPETESVEPSEHGVDAILRDVDAAADEAGLRTHVGRALTVVTAEFEAGATAAAAWSEVLMHGVAAGVRLTAGPADWTWFVSGSVARREAAPGSDVETMIALGDSVDADQKTALSALAADVHGVLERCGIAGDANGVLAGRPRFCRRLRSWNEGIGRWAATPHEDRGVVMAGLVADSTGLLGALPEDVLRAEVVAAAGRCYPVRQAMLQDATALRATVPSRLRVFVKSADSVDLKLAAVDPVVKIARWAALSAGSDALSTSTRLTDSVDARVLDADDASSLRECFDWLLRFRWRLREEALLSGRPIGDTVVLSEMAPQDRATLRSVAREVSGVSRKLSYLASTSAFR